MHDWLLVIGGLIALIVGGDILVRGAVSLATRLGISALIVSLTVVAFGTSAPELLIGIQSALEGVPELAIGNVDLTAAEAHSINAVFHIGHDIFGRRIA